MVLYTIGAVLIGLGSGVLSGVFGVGGGLIMTPLLLLILGTPALQAAETPMIAILPTTITGSIVHLRAKNVDVRTALLSGGAGVVTAFLGALAATRVGGTVVIVATGIVLVFSAIEIFRRSCKPDVGSGEKAGEEALCQPRPATWIVITAGLLAGFGSGFLGVGGGFLLVPLYAGVMKFSMKRSAGTSLLAIAIMSVPGLITHMSLGNIDVRLGLLVAAGAIPGAIFGAKLGLGTNEKVLRIGFGILMVITGIILALTQFGLI